MKKLLLIVGLSKNQLKKKSVMSAWRIHSFSGGVDQLKLNESTKIPTITRPNDVLIQVKAASVNPLDAQMKDGYGKTFVGLMRQVDQRSLTNVSEFPLTLGRDCSGIVVDTGRSVKKFKAGDEVYCALGAERQGTFAEYAVADACTVALKPKKLSFAEAASIPYVCCTVWSALCTAGGLDRSHRQQSILIHGGSGGIGTFAIQLAKVYGATVTTACSADAFDLVTGLGADNVVDYKSDDAFQKLSNFSPYDLIFDSVNSELSNKTVELLGLWRGSMFVSIANPLLRDSDEWGFPLGLFKSASTFAQSFVQSIVNGKLYVWAFVIPNGNALAKVTEFIDAGKIRPVVSKIYKFKELPEALNQVSLLRGRGKLVVDLSDS